MQFDKLFTGLIHHVFKNLVFLWLWQLVHPIMEWRSTVVAGLMDATIKAIAICSLYFLRNYNVGEERKEDFLKSSVCQLIVCTIKDYRRLPKTTEDDRPVRLRLVTCCSRVEEQATGNRRRDGQTREWRHNTISNRNYNKAGPVYFFINISKSGRSLYTTTRRRCSGHG